ncbi:molybdopterin binding oxidoreductase [Dacryopinax primogenitus]|uniref:Molybdopterin binding oxidoreductase n=1 Tax=Dacryopinax primogenitus (strain DJM 731) TaxID=1858805 RepID=M5GDP3_DACPD|nr:molybdopterin binding oxidoreductase [Dacryopinax primogenitus]EJU02593.1 molybdopterin binding oxidoreductase [Dacryopinax primogenitus]
MEYTLVSKMFTNPNGIEVLLPAPVEPKSELLFNAGVYDGAVPFKETNAGWHGYIPWTDHPQWKQLAKEILDGAQQQAIESPFKPGQAAYDDQTTKLRVTGGIVGTRFSEYFMRLGAVLYNWPAESWETIKKDKDRSMLHVLSFPYNGEATKDDIVKHVITPNPLHFVRNHGNIPIIDANTWLLELGGLVNQPKSIKFDQLKSGFPTKTVTATLVCSGTRRKEQQMEALGEFDELINAPWTEQALGTARWTGVTLKTLVDYCGGLRDEATDIEFYGADTYFKRNKPDNYIVSIPIRKMEDTIIAFEMNGELLTPTHGAPVRAVVPGYIGARSVKWLYRIKALPHPSLAPVQSEEYLYFTHQMGKHNFRWSDGFQIGGMPISSAIMSPKNGEVVYHNGKVKVTGWAYTGGTSNWVERVEVSPNGGSDWYPVSTAQLSQKFWWAWRLFAVEVPTPAQGYLDFTVRAWDGNMNTQPTLVRDGWNWDTHVTNSCHHIQIYSVNLSDPQTALRLAQLHKHGLAFEPVHKPLEMELEDEVEYLNRIREGSIRRDPVE